MRHTLFHEFHFPFECIAYQLERSAYYVNKIPDIERFMLSNDADKMMWMMLPDNIKDTGKYNALYRKRRDILYKKN